MRRLALFAALSAVALSAGMCATDPAKLPPPAPVQAVTCLPMRTYTKAEQDAARTQLQTIPADSPLARWIVDYGALRDADRAACQTK